jgi:hypothetical protein
MTAGAALTSSVILEKSYVSDQLRSALAETTPWAELKVDELAKARTDLYPWRKDADVP